MVLDGKSSQEYPFNAGVPKGSILGSTCFLPLMNFLKILSVILLPMLTVLFILSVIRHLICGNNLNWLLNLNLIYKTLWTGVRSGLLISVLGNLKLVLFDWMGLFLRENHLS